ncbi:MAG TPA: biotin--[acetyl-CoA-carboxylase] ligase [Candidatus Thioglobus sp.]|nr:biotin--[acetyl-CoA-carboxylase] ligase [Candidatus Thioglobus sp.]HIL21497.1 biotin--[acetyl-CoA-carboxylase] ligase [Candidatus Thioglobus sp.]
MVDYSTLENFIDQQVDCVFFDSIESTNDYLLTQPFSETTQLCITREQTKGKGQHGRVWCSQKDGSVLFSIRQNFDASCDLSGLSLVVALAIVKSLEGACAIEKLSIKWPNDIYFGDKKLSGILLENQLHGDKQSVVIGVGVNYALGANLGCETPWVDLTTISDSVANIKALTVAIINAILAYVKRFEKNGFEDFQSEWAAYDMLKGRMAKVGRANNSYTGEVTGVNSKGALLISSEGGVETMYSSEQITYI